VKALLGAVKQKRITEKRIAESVSRILMAKARVGLHRKKLVDLEEISETIEASELADQAQLAADRAVTLVKNDDDALPLKSTAGACFWVMSESRYGQGGRRFAEEIRSRTTEARVALLDPQVSVSEMTDLVSKAGQCQTHVAAAFITVGAYRGNVALSGNYPALMEMLVNSGAPVVLTSLGNPYLLRSFPNGAAYVAAFSPVPTAEAAAAKALLGEIPIGGRLPVSIPDVAKIGDGITVPAVTR
jgi:beta-N-acetylhexosaminidase